MTCWHPRVDECGGYLVCVACGRQLDGTDPLVAEQDKIVEQIIRRADMNQDLPHLSRTAVRQVLTLADVYTPEQVEAVFQEVRTTKADLIEAYKSMDAVSRAMKPNWSNDMPWEDEIIICHENIKQEAAELQTALNNQTVVLKFLQRENRELFEKFKT